MKCPFLKWGSTQKFFLNLFFFYYIGEWLRDRKLFKSVVVKINMPSGKALLSQNLEEFN